MERSELIYDIAIIGAGFCGAMLLANLVEKAGIPLKIAIIEKTSVYAKGVAYSTEDPSHLLNVRAIKMGAFDNDPEHFYQWLLAHEAEWRKLDRSFEKLKLDPEGYVPRKIYGAYLENLWDETLKEAVKKNIQIAVLSQEAVNIEMLSNNNQEITLQDGKKIESKYTTLAIGVLANREFLDSQHPVENYISNIWIGKEAGRLIFSTGTSKDQKIVIIGSGLTMLDAATTLLNKGYQGHITVISLDGKLPEPHKGNLKSQPIFIDIRHPPKTSLGLLKIIRKEVADVVRQGGDWRSVIDALRPITVDLWMSLPMKEKKIVKRYLFGLWNRHRHRVPPEYLEKIERLREDGKISLIPGLIHSVKPTGHGKLKVDYKEASKGIQTLEADYVINCAGPNFNLLNNKSPLIRNLLENKIIQSHPLNWGIAASPSYEASGKNDGRIFAIGLILIGERFESIAVPDLRQQCADLAERLVYML